MNISIRRMEVFVAVIDEGSFAAAAERFGIAQPSVSNHIFALERDIGGAVFERRRGRKPTLTDLGRSVLLYAREMLADASDMSAEVVKLRNSTGQRVVLSCQRSLANFALKKAITDFALLRPDIQLVVRIGKQEDVIDDVRDGTADIGCFLDNQDIRDLPAEVIGFERLVLICAPGHRLAGKKAVKAREIERCDFVGPPPASRFGRSVSKLLDGAGISNIRVAAQATEYQFLREFVVAGVGISCSLERNIRADAEKGLLSVIDFDGPDLIFQIRQIMSPRKQLSPSMIELKNHLSTALQTGGKQTGQE